MASTGTGEALGGVPPAKELPKRVPRRDVDRFPLLLRRLRTSLGGRATLSQCATVAWSSVATQAAEDSIIRSLQPRGGASDASVRSVRSTPRDDRRRIRHERDLTRARALGTISLGASASLCRSACRRKHALEADLAAARESAPRTCRTRQATPSIEPCRSG